MIAKCIKKDAVPLETIFKEITVMNRLAHKHVAKLCEVYESKNSVYLIMEYYEN